MMYTKDNNFCLLLQMIQIVPHLVGAILMLHASMIRGITLAVAIMDSQEMGQYARVTNWTIEI